MKGWERVWGLRVGKGRELWKGVSGEGKGRGMCKGREGEDEGRRVLGGKGSEW